MGVVPDYAQVTHPDFASASSVDWDILAAADANTGVVSGCVVAAQSSPNMTVQVAAGRAMVNNVQFDVAAAASLSIGANASGSDRIDLVYVSALGVPAVTAGTPATHPKFPAVPTNSTALAVVYVVNGASSITANEIWQKSITVPNYDTLRTPVLGSKVVVHGHSLATGGGSTTADASYPDYIGALLKTPVNDLAKGGAVLAWSESQVFPYPAPGAVGDGGWVQIFQRQDFQRLLAPYVPRPQLTIVGYGDNDLGWGRVLSVFQETMRAVLAYLSAGRLHPDNDGSFVVPSAGWPARVADTSTNYGTGYRPAAANGEYIIYVAPTDFAGGTLDLFFVATPSSGGSLTFTLNGVAQTVTAAPADGTAQVIGLTGTQAFQDRTYLKNGAQKNVPIVYRVQNVPASRTDVASVTNGSATVADTSITSADAGKLVSGTGIPGLTYVGTITAGVSFLLSSSPTSQVNVTATAPGTSVILRPVVRATVANRTTLSPPAQPTVTPTGGAAGSYTYDVVAVNVNGDTIPSTARTIANGPTSLSGTNFNTVTWTRVPGASGYKVRRTAGGATQGLIATLTGNDQTDCTLKDTGLTAGVYTAAVANPNDGGFYFNFAAVEATPMPVILVPGLFRFLNQAAYDTNYTNWPAGTTTDADIATWNTGLQTTLTEFSQAKYVNVDVAKTFGAAMFGPDNIHPNDYGHAKVAQAVVQVLNNVVPTMTLDQLTLQSREPRYSERCISTRFTGAANINIPSSQTTFALLNLSGSNLTSAIVAQPGDLILVELIGGWSADNLYSYLDIATLNGVTPVNYFSSGTASAQGNGVTGWYGLSNATATRTSAATGSTTSGSNSITIPSGFLTNADAGKLITGTNIPAGTRVLAVTALTTALLTANASATASGTVAFTVGATAFASSPPGMLNTNADVSFVYEKISGRVGYVVGINDVISGVVTLGIMGRVAVPTGSTATQKSIFTVSPNNALVMVVENRGITSPYQAG